MFKISDSCLFPVPPLKCSGWFSGGPTFVALDIWDANLFNKESRSTRSSSKSVFYPFFQFKFLHQKKDKDKFSFPKFIWRFIIVVVCCSWLYFMSTRKCSGGWLKAVSKNVLHRFFFFLNSWYYCEYIRWHLFWLHNL